MPKKCGAKYQTLGPYGIVACTRVVGHEGSHRYNRPGHAVHWPDSVNHKEPEDGAHSDPAAR